MDETATGDNDGTSWADAFLHLLDGLAEGDPGETVFVAKGTYYPDECNMCGLFGTDDQSVSFNVPLRVVVEGGYAGLSNNPLDPFERNFVLYESILSGDILQDDVNSPAQNPGDINGFNSFHVLTIIRPDVQPPPPTIDGTVVDGFTITAGNANGGPDNLRVGGGAFVVDMTIIVMGPLSDGPKFRNCTFVGNRSEDVGGALACLDVGVEVRDCLILNNETMGGSFSRLLGLVTIYGGGGIAGSAPFVLVNSRIIGNECAGEGGGGGVSVESSEDSKIVLASCFFAGNRALKDVNDGGGQGGGATIAGGEVMNCVFTGNLADFGDPGGTDIAGGGLHGAADVYLSTFYGNDAPNGNGGGVAFLGSNSSITNSIAWGNTDRDGNDWTQQIFSATGICPTWSNIEDWDCQVGQCGDCNLNNICADPYFVDAQNDDLHLALNSPSIDKGSDDFPLHVPKDSGDVNDDTIDDEELPWDLDKFPRMFDGVVGTPNDIDQGAYEEQSLACPWDLNGDGMVSAADLLLLLANWGQTCNHADFNGNDDVGAADLLALLANWGLCPGETGPEPLTLQEELDDACLTWDDWDHFVDVMTDPNAPQVKKDRYYCWMTHYLFDCNKCICIGASGCPNPDPFN